MHSFANVIGDVTVGEEATIAPGTSVRADAESPFYIGDHANIQNGVIIQGLNGATVVGDRQREYAVWIGRNSCIAHLASSTVRPTLETIVSSAFVRRCLTLGWVKGRW